MNPLATFCTIICVLAAIIGACLGINAGYEAIKQSGWEERDQAARVELANLGEKKDQEMLSVGRDLQNAGHAHARTRAIFSSVMLGLAQLADKDRPYIAGLGFEASGFTVGHGGEQVAYEYTRDASGKITGIIQLDRKK